MAGNGGCGVLLPLCRLKWIGVLCDLRSGESPGRMPSFESSKFKRVCLATQSNATRHVDACGTSLQASCLEPYDRHSSSVDLRVNGFLSCSLPPMVEVACVTQSTTSRHDLLHS